MSIATRFMPLCIAVLFFKIYFKDVIVPACHTLRRVGRISNNAEFDLNSGNIEIVSLKFSCTTKTCLWSQAFYRSNGVLVRWNTLELDVSSTVMLINGGVVLRFLFHFLVLVMALLNWYFLLQRPLSLSLCILCLLYLCWAGLGIKTFYITEKKFCFSASR